MAYTFKKFASDVFHLPGRTYKGISSLLLGYSNDNPGLLGWIAMAVGTGMSMMLSATVYIGRGISRFLESRQQAIDVGFWASLAAAGGAALCVALWPAALAAVTTFTIAGLSIASVVGAGFAAQVGAVAAVAAVATNTTVHTVAVVFDTCMAIGRFIAGCCCACKDPKASEDEILFKSQLSSLNFNKKAATTANTNVNPTSTALFSKESPAEASNQDLEMETDYKFQSPTSV